MHHSVALASALVAASHLAVFAEQVTAFDCLAVPSSDSVPFARIPFLPFDLDAVAATVPDSKCSNVSF